MLLRRRREKGGRGGGVEVFMQPERMGRLQALDAVVV